MAIEVAIPTLGESITGGLIAAWHVADGDFVQEGQPLYELETDKITSEGTAATAGRISIRAEVGEEVDVGQVIAVIDETAQAPATPSESPAKPGAEEKQGDDAEPAMKREPEKDTAAEKDFAASTERPARTVAPVDPSQSPAVRRLAAESGIDVASVSGSGKGGRATKGDLLEMIQSEAAEASGKQATSAEEKVTEIPAPTSSAIEPGTPSDRPTTRRKMSPLRRRIAERLVSAQQTAAILTTFNEADMTAVMELRKKHQESFTQRHGIKLGFMSFFVKACVRALKEVPGLNAQLDGSDIVENHYFDIGVAVSTEKGLMVPVIRGCDSISFAEVESRIVEYASKAREGKMAVSDLQGGVFTITNGGIFGSLLSTPIINQPQSGILGMHTIQERPVVINGQIVARPMMYLALSYDHRIVDGREAVTFLVRVKEAIEDPARLLLGA